MVMHANDALAHGSTRLPPAVLAAVEDVARGVEEGEAGLKSCAVADRDISCGVAKSEARSMHHALEVSDEDECFNLIGDYLAKGFSFSEVARMVRLDGSGVHLLALERWCDLARLACDLDEVLPDDHTARRWRAAPRFERRRRCRRAMVLLRQTHRGAAHAAVLHVVYGWPDPFLRTLAPEARSALGLEFGPLARYTDVVEAKRQELVRAMAANDTRREYTPALAREQVGGLRALVVRAGEVDEEHRLAVNLGVAPGGHVFDLARHRSRLAWADRTISSGDALRAALAPPRVRFEHETSEHYRDHVAGPAKAAREAFITQVRIDANRMLSAACAAFLDAWNRS